MSLMNLIPDLLKAFRIPASGAPDVITGPHSFGVTVNIGAAVPLRADRTGVEVIIMTASLGNLGVIYVGGPECDVNNGVELDNGRGLLLTVTNTSMQFSEGMLSSLGVGLISRIDALTPGARKQIMSEFGALAARPKPSLIIPLNNIFVTASANAQTLRCLYMLPARV